MNDASGAAVLAYKETRDTVVREYPLRLVASAGVAWIVAEAGYTFLAVLWWVVVAGLLGVEALIYRRVFRRERRSMPARLAALFAVVSFATAVVYTAPAWLMVAEGSPAFLFAAAAFMAGTLIHLTVHNANTRLIYASAALPMSVTLVAVGVVLAIEASSFIPLLTVLLFVAAMIAAYLGRLESVRQINAAMAEALKEREAARRASAAKSAFLAKMSHELRTPLNGILGMAEALRPEMAPGELRETVETIRRSGGSLNEMLNEILDYTLIEAGGFKFQPSAKDIREILKDVIETFRPAAAEKGLALTLDIDEVAEPWIKIDGPRVRQALAHLVDNAVRFTDSGAVLVKARVVRSARAGVVDLAFVVSDTGIGMTAEQSERVLEAFEQADNSITRRYGGVGLGLSLVRGWTLAAGGEMTVRSAPGAGTTVEFRFPSAIAAPAADETEKTPLEPAASEPASEKVRILLVEDNAVNRQVVRALLRPMDVEVDDAENGAEALKRLDSAPFDLILMDLHMPVMDGLSATRAIRTSEKPWSRVPVVALTAAAAPEDRAASLKAGMNDFLSKPVKAEVLAQVVRRYAKAAAGQSPPARAMSG